MLEVWSRGPEVIGQRLADVTEPAFARLFDEVLRSGAPRIGREGTFPLPGGSGEAAPARFFNYELGPLVDEAGTVSGVLACAFEVTDQVKARDEAEAANRAKDEFLATMSHELRTPLQSIHGWASILIHGSADAAKREHGLEVIQRNARAQERLINDLLEMSRIVSGKLKLVLSSAPLWDVVHAAVDVVRPAADAKEVRLLIDVDPDLPRLVVDPARLQQVVWNLLTNSVKFTPRGGQITVTGDQVGSHVRLRVRDTGPGIPANQLPLLFQRFRQLDASTTRAHGGLGLGLAIVRHLVEAHGGTVEAASEGVSKGATFTVLLPFPAVDSDAPPPGSLDLVRTGPPQQRLENVRVLLVEDDKDSLEVVREVLEAAGATVIPARSAREALAVRAPFDVIVSDIGMPAMDGYAMIRSIRERAVGGATPALALTAYARTDDVEQVRRAGYQEHIAKPVDPVRLVEAISRWAPTERAG